MSIDCEEIKSFYYYRELTVIVEIVEVHSDSWRINKDFWVDYVDGI